MRTSVLLALSATSWLLLSSARAQSLDRRYVEEPTGGLSLPATPLAGEHDARAATVNPGGLPLLRGPELALALSLEDPEIASSAGAGFGAFVAASGGGSLAPRYGIGLGLEWLRPPRARLSPDPGEPFRLTTSFAVAAGRSAGLGVAWHHFVDDGRLAGVDTFDLGYSARVGNRLALGATLRDLATGDVGGAPVQRRYELELLVRPLATDLLEVAGGGRVGETRGDLDAWTRWTVRAARGVFVTGAVESRAVFAVESSPSGLSEVEARDLRATLGIEVSFGGLGVASYATALRDERGANHAVGSTTLLRLSGRGPASVLGATDRIERVELSGSIDARELTQLVVRLRAIARDAHVRGVVVMLDGVEGGWATLQELRDELVRVRAAGKKLFAYMVFGTGRDYFVASAADRIYVDPAGGLRLVGLAATTLYFRGAFDQIGVSPQFERIAEYKSAPEQLTETGPTGPAARMQTELYDSLWQQWLAAVAEGRRRPVEEIAALVDAGPYTAGDLARLPALVDAVAPPDTIGELVVRELGAAYPISGPPAERPERWQRPGVAVIYVDGDIADGKSRTLPIVGRSFAGGETLSAAIASARDDARVGAIVLRIDSPGGSALASELVAREVFATRGVKPIVCSLSDVAASGGYFIAAGCDLIFAEPMTITGSIGIFYGKFDLSGLLAKLGFTVETQRRGRRGDLESMFRPYTAEERGVLQDKLRYMYSRFVGAVAEGRKLSRQQVDERGRGHVYTGATARPLQLVDRFGGLGDALEEAKRRMGLPPATRVQLIELPAPPSLLSGLLRTLGGARLAAPPASELFELPVLRSLLRGVPGSLLLAPSNGDAAQARLPYDIVFE